MGRKAGRRLATWGALVVLYACGTVSLEAWGAQGHRVVALLAAERLTPAARANVRWLLSEQSLADVAEWADDYRDSVTQTAPWHFVNVPDGATAYDRDRDCPRQPGVAAGSRNDRWRDCVVDRITYNQERLADARLDRADRAMALKFLVHLVGDIHQPFHAVGVARGGNGIPVSAFGSNNCALDAAQSFPCNLHGVWDVTLIAHRQLRDQALMSAVGRAAGTLRLDQGHLGRPEEWALESFRLAGPAMLPAQGVVDDAYERAQHGIVDQQLARAGVRLAGILNAALASAPPQR